jgi:hypothetical protein
LKGSWLHLAVVDPGNDLCYLNCCRDGGNNKRAPPVGFYWLNISFFNPNSILWFIRVHESCQANRSLSLTQSLIFESVKERACIYCLRVRSPIFLRSPCRLLTKGGACQKSISKGKRPICLVGLDLLLSKFMGSN